ncbi:hypothetical protein V502_00458 [Pseudogymnoascus sp. VKM F-4520 (FW-2644)]|nr:hypothetical protein V502_00458 [Pseudogymnoascus sp. VKM F-4520 (FW-2644)]
MARKSVMEDLDTPDRIRVLRIIDQLRDLGVSEDISLPQVNKGWAPLNEQSVGNHPIATGSRTRITHKFVDPSNSALRGVHDSVLSSADVSKCCDQSRLRLCQEYLPLSRFVSLCSLDSLNARPPDMVTTSRYGIGRSETFHGSKKAPRVKQTTNGNRKPQTHESNPQSFSLTSTPTSAALEQTAALGKDSQYSHPLLAIPRCFSNPYLYFMTELEEKFDELDLAQYLDRFLEQGFDTWDTILDITERDLDVLRVKIGHRRRKIATTRRVSHAQALTSPKPSFSGLNDRLLEAGTGVTASRSDGTDSSSLMQPSGKRKYRKHPKPDQYAPAMPRSAYVMFSNKMREDLKVKSLSFTEIAKLVGKSWRNLTTSEKEPYERQAFDAKEKYMIDLAGYVMTGSYKTYSEYLLDFKAKQLRTQESNQQPPNETFKVPKLQNTPTTAAKPGTTLAGYCNTVIGASAQTLAWGSQARPKDIPVPEHSQQNRRNFSLPGILNGVDTSVGVGAGQTFHSQPRSVGAFTPPSLTPELTPSTLQSTLSTQGRDSQSQRSTATRKLLEQSRDKLFLPIPRNFSDAGTSKALEFHKPYPPTNKRNGSSPRTAH